MSIKTALYKGIQQEEEKAEDVAELRWRRGRHFSSPCLSAVHLSECFRTPSLATAAALSSFSFQTPKTAYSHPASSANSLTANIWGGASGGVTWEENIPSISGKINQSDERDSFEKSAVLFGVCQRSD